MTSSEERVEGSSRRRVCAVAYTHYRSDPRVRREAEALHRRGDDVTVLALREPGRPSVDDVDGVRVVGFPVPRHRGDGLVPYLLSYGRFFLRAAWHLGRRPRSYDLVHVHSLPEAMVFAALVPRLAGRPVLLDVHDLSTEVIASRRGSTPAPVRWLERMSLRFADHVVTVHEDYRDRITSRGIKPDRVTVVLNTPDPAIFPITEPGVPATPPRLVYHGTLVERYGLGVAIRAVAAVRDQLPGITCELVGDGDFRPEIVRLVDELDLGGVVELSEGAVAVDAVPAHIRAADVGLVPFIDDVFTESILPTKLLEYVALGKPVIVSRNPVIESYFDERSVFYVTPGRAEQVSAAIVSIASDPGAAAARARRAQRFFEREGWPAARARFLQMVDEVIER